ncbi:DUF935 domain-containing protein [Enterovibrio norvegicus]|uniref:DUF935 domain-containing protein n=1 Tax=Enterovibrio norvegicus TaxID=188144 RepID=UPI0024B08C94|nr:DUF935 domain-containing protein [Enterovibrio norvegicus]
MIINPATNKPFTREEKEELQAHHSRAHVTSVRRPMATHSIASYLTPARLANVLRNAINGQAEDYFVLAEEMEERDTHYRSVLSTRKLAAASLSPTVEAASDDEQDQALAEAVRQLLRHPQWEDCVFDLLDGIGKGIGLVEMLWDTTDTPWQPYEYKWVDPRFLRLDEDTQSELRLVTDDSPSDGEPLASNKYLVHLPRMKSGHWLRAGLARVVAVMYMLKSFTVRDWWAFAEVFGMPIRVGKYHSNASDEDIRTLINAIATIASDAGAAIPESMQIEMVETAKGSGGDTLFENMAEWADRQISKTVLGQTMTTDDGSSQSQAKVHNEVRQDIINWDARQLANTLNAHLVKPFIDMNWGPQKQYPRIIIKLEESEDIKAWVEAITPLIDRGMKVQASEVRDRVGLSDPDDDGELLHAVNNQPTNSPALNRQQLALNRALPAIDTEAEIDELVNSGLNEWEAVSAPILNPILDAAKQADSFEAFNLALNDIANELDASAFAEQLAALCWQARALGDVTDG